MCAACTIALAARARGKYVCHYALPKRRILDKGGCRNTRIFLSGSLDELTIERLLTDGVPADGFGVGTRLDVSADHPSLDCAYKLQEYAGRATRKRSSGKATWPGRKQILRHRDAGGRLSADEIVLDSDAAAGERLLIPIMRVGRRLGAPPTLRESRERARREIELLPPSARSLTQRFRVPVEVAPAIVALAEELDRSDHATP